MREEYLHVADEQLLLYASGELRRETGAEVQSHVESCLQCRLRLRGLEDIQAELAGALGSAWNGHLCGTDAARASLRGNLTELEAGRLGRSWGWGVFEPGRTAALAGLTIAACVLLAFRLYGPSEKPVRLETLRASLEEPDLRLTPGATIPITASEVCGTAAQVTSDVPEALKQKVFELYGVRGTKLNEYYEVDYLITPELGGATDIRNLWPQPYQDATWNARVKDQLEDRLHRMVCRGELDLATAQRELSSDWIAAYRKYFHADRPIPDDSSLGVREIVLPHA